MIKPISLAVILKDFTPHSCQLWLQRRVSDDALNGLWEFPGGKIEPGETAVTAVLRELKEEVDWSYSAKPMLFKIYSLPMGEKTMHFHVFFLTDTDGLPEKRGEWFKFDYGDQANFLGLIPPLNVQMMEEIGIYFSKNYTLYGSH